MTRRKNVQRHLGDNIFGRFEEQQGSLRDWSRVSIGDENGGDGGGVAG
jgi:hypothetical protein